MFIEMMKSKISYATVTQTELYYVGSITIDSEILAQANMRANEKVQVVNLNNGERLETYIIAGEAGSKVICLNGPAARKAAIGDQLFIITYAWIDPATEKNLEPVVVDMRDL